MIRFNNTSAYIGCRGGCVGGSPIGYMAQTGNGFTCYSPMSTTGSHGLKAGQVVPCLNSTYYDVAQGAPVTPTWTASAQSGPTAFAPAGTPAARAGATWDSLWSGNATGALNTVRPRFTNAALQDQWRPSDKFLINASVRYDNFTYVLPDSANTANIFYANQVANYTCVLAATNQLMTQPLAAGQLPPANAQYVVGDCNKAAVALFPTGPHTGWVHPNGTVQDGVAAPNFTSSSPGSYALNYWQPRFSATFTASPDTVFRASAGRFTQPPISASVQYLSSTGDNRSLWSNMINLGFYSPFHPLPGISSAQYDLSWEQHLHGTDMSFKLTPYYTWVNGWQQQTFIGPGFVTQVPVGVNRDYGVEFQFNKGDFTRNGLSGQLAFSYTNSKVQFTNYGLSNGGVVPNTITALNQVITAYNAADQGGQRRQGLPLLPGAQWRAVLQAQRLHSKTRSSTPTTTCRRRRCWIPTAGTTRTRRPSRRTCPAR